MSEHGTNLPKCPQPRPYIVELERGTYLWCSCGASTKQPFCDGSHKGTDFVPVRTEIFTTQMVSWCGCKRTGDQPYCDGTHSELT